MTASALSTIAGEKPSMLDDNDTTALHRPDPERVYHNYLERCRRLGIEPVLRDHARDLMAEWSVAIEASRQTKH
jgi:hypothetical protein